MKVIAIIKINCNHLKSCILKILYNRMMSITIKPNTKILHTIFAVSKLRYPIGASISIVVGG
jgi:hypothetical protein